MASTPKRKASLHTLEPRFRVVVGKDVALGPGKIELLGHIASTGSIARAAAAMGMSYMRAWTLVQTMNRCFREPLVSASRGGKASGGATLTSTGKRALELYQQIEEASRHAVEPFWQEILPMLPK